MAEAEGHHNNNNVSINQASASASSASASASSWKYSLPAFIRRNKKTLCASTAIFLLVASLIIIIILTSNCFHPRVHVVSSFVGGGETLPTSWAVNLNLVNPCDNSPYRVDRVEAAVLRKSDDTLIAITQRFALRDVREDKSSRKVLEVGIQLRTVSEDRRQPRPDRAALSDFGVLILVWVHTQPAVLARKSFFARFSCSPVWIGGSSAGSSAVDQGEDKCVVQVTRQAKVDESWMRLNMTRPPS